MERLLGETEQQYVARQTRLREEAKQRMAAKFGNGGLSGGVSSSSGSGSRMQGIGSDSRYNPGTGGYGASGGTDFDVNSLVSGFGSVLGSAMNTAKSLADEQTIQSIKSTGVSFWGGLTSTVSNVAASITSPQDGADGLAELQRQIAAQKSSTPTSSNKYGGFGSDSFMNSAMSSSAGTTEPARSMQSVTAPSFHAPNHSTTGGASSTIQEAQGLPGEDRNGIERLTGESDEQYVIRQTRLRDEARARMAAKFGGGGLGSSSSGSTSNHNNNNSSGVGSTMMSSTITAAPSSSGSSNRFSATASTTSSSLVAPRSAPSSGNFPRNKTPPKMMNSNDFFSSFGN
jgi:hypothetical protein